MLLLLLFLSLCLGCHAKQPAVSLSNGTVLGALVSVGGRTARQFLGIPYAQPPVGALRFAPPRPVTAAWRGPLNATGPPNRCPQVEVFPLTFDAYLPKEILPKMDEDCLSLSVWAPVNASKTNLKAVMVWLHGGGYLMGDSFPTQNGAGLAALEDVVVVIPNYRLGVFGFLRLGDEVAGNWGLWDQQLALRWVQENIAAFGGNPDRVTVFGESAGGGSTSLHLLNPTSAALFRRAILQSGSYACFWVMNPNLKAIEELHRRFAASFQCRGSEAAVVECLRRQKAADLAARQVEMSPEFVFLPVIDGRFLKDSSPFIKKPDKEVMIGVCEEEGTFLIKLLLERNNGSINMMQDALLASGFLRTDYFPSNFSQLETEALRWLIQSHGDLSNRTQQIRRAADAMGDAGVICPANNVADDLASRGGTVYMFEFGYRSSYSRLPDGFGATHWDDVAYEFGLQEIYPAAFNASRRDKEVAREMMRELASFAKEGRPANSAWRPFSRSAKDFFRFSSPSGPRRGGIRRNECVLWNEVLPRLMARRTEGKYYEKCGFWSRPWACGSVRSAHSPHMRQVVIASLMTAVALALRWP